MVNKITLKKIDRPYCPLCKTYMIPDDDMLLTDGKTKARVWICNCEPDKEVLTVEL